MSLVEHDLIPLLQEEEIDPCCCRALWCAVIAEQWKLAFEPTSGDRPEECWRARRWFGSQDCATAACLAGIDFAVLRATFEFRLVQEAGADRFLECCI